jgi:hypothetical protein
MTIMLEETSDGDGGGDCFRASLPVAPDGTWRREVIPLSAFHYVYAKGNRGNGKLDRRRPMHLAFIVYNCPRSFSVRIDALQWMRTAQRSAALTTQTSQPVRSKNLLPGDTSFETGIGTWSYMQQVGEPRTVVGDAAFGQRCLALSKGEPGVQSGWTYDLLKAGAPHVLSFYAKGQPGSKVNIGVMGMGWIVVGGATFDVTNEWKQYHYVVPVQSGTLTAYMGFSAVPIDASPVLIDALQLEAGTTPTAYEPAEAIVLAAGIDATAQIAVARKDAPPTMTVRISNARLSDDRQPMTLGATIKQFDGPVLSQFSESITLKSGASWEKSIPMTMAAEPGYTVVDWVLRDAHDAIVAKMQSPFVVVPESVATSEVPVLRDGFFGIHSHWVPADAMRRIGVTWIRSGLPPWDYIEGTRGVFRDFSATDFHAQGFRWLTTLHELGNPPAWARGENGLTAKGEFITPFATEMTKQFAGKVDAFETQNEPDLTMVNDKRPSDVVAKNIAEMLKGISPATRAAKVPLMLNVSGGFPAEAFAETVFAHADNAFDVYGPHPYTFPRYIGPYGGYVAGPEAGDVRGQLLRAQALIDKYGGKQELWIGELGYALDYQAEVDSVWATMHAAFLARTFLMAKSVPQVKHLMWFLDIGCIEGSRYEYGIWRKDTTLKPLPATAAYATAARMIDHSHCTALTAAGAMMSAVFERDGETIIAVWNSSSKPTVDVLPIVLNADDAHAVSMTGSTIAPNKETKTLTLNVTGSPVYVLPRAQARDRVIATIANEIKNRQRLAIRLSATARTTAMLHIDNTLDEPFAGEISVAIDGETKTLPIALSAKETTALPIALAQPLPIAGAKAVVKCTAANGPTTTATFELPPMQRCVKVDRIDWNTLDLSQADNVIVLDQRTQVLPADPTVGWNGPSDLSAKVFFAWSRTHLYVVADVTDDVHRQTQSGTLIWRGDSMQIGIDTLHDATNDGGYDSNDYEFGLARVGEKPVVWCWQAAAGKPFECAKTFPADVAARPDGVWRYRVAIPWGELAPLKPVAGTVFGMNLIVSDDDGHGVNYFIGLAPGLAPGKRPALFPSIVLEEDAEKSRRREVK